MILLTIDNFLTYCFIAWGTNMLLNVLGIIKLHFPNTVNLDKPIDFGLEYKGDRLIGESTTIVGLILSILISVVMYFAKFNFIWISIPLLVYCGHTLGSIIKRRMHKKGGEFVPFVDHGDYMILTGIVFVIMNYISFSFAILGLFVTYILHPIVCFIAFRLKLRKIPY
jgi:hypothetical protein